LVRRDDALALGAHAGTIGGQPAEA
jgi:hypothetical protein